MRAMVLAAGLGKRMRPLSEHTPKPLIEVAGKALIDWSLDALVEAGITQIVVNASYLGDQVAAHVAAYARADIQLSMEESPLETGGGIKQALPLLGEAPFLVMNSDAFCLPGAAAIAQLCEAAEHSSKKMQLLLQPVEQTVGYQGAGDFFCEEGVVRRKAADERAPYVFTGMQIIDPALFAAVAENVFSMNLLYDRERDAQGGLPLIEGVVHTGTWLHVGTPEQKADAERYLAARAA